MGEDTGQEDVGGGWVSMPKWAKTPPVVNRIQSALSRCRVHRLEEEDGSGEGVSCLLI